MCRSTAIRAHAILHEWVKTTGAEMNEARLRMTRIPKGADLILNKVSGAPGFWIDNVIVMAGVPSIMQAMLDEVAPKLKTGVRMLSETVRADAREGNIGMQLGEIAKANPGVAIGSYPFFDPQHGPIPIDVKVGDRVLFGKWSGTEVKLDGVEYMIMKESDLMGVLVESGGSRKAA